MPADLQATLLQLFEQVQQDPNILPAVPLDEWQEGSSEWHLLDRFRVMAEQIQQRIQQLQQAEQQLHEREEQYRSIFEATTDALFITDLAGTITEANPAACSMTSFDYSELIGKRISLIDPALTQTYQDRTTLPGNAESSFFWLERGRITRKDGTRMVVEGRSTTFTYKGEPHLLGVVHDITEQVEAERQLREREEQYRGIFEATTDALFVEDLEDGHIIEANPAACAIYGYAYEEFIGLPQSAIIHPDQLAIFQTQGLPTLRAGGKRHKQGVNLRKDGSAFPIDLHQITLTYQGKPHILSIVRDITEQVEARHLLEQRVQERTRELSTLLEVSHNVASTLELKPLLGLILDQLKSVVEYSGASINTLEEESLVIVEYRGFRPAEQMVGRRFPLKHAGLLWETMLRSEPAVINDVLAETPLAHTYRALVGGDLLNTSADQIGAWMAVPLVLKEQVMGMLTVTARESDYFTPHHAALAQAVANQAAIAIANARLYEQAQALAALKERQKLARELHDSVSQALYGIALGAHSARTALQRDPEHMAEPLDYVLSLAEAGLAEMRALIFELRPESLETEGLVAALTKQGTALQARHELRVHLDLCDEPALPLAIKQELYRIAQEAMHNTVKHARARQVDLRLSQTSEVVLLEVRDDGVGFDPEGNFPGHLGLHSMRERVSHLGGTLQIESAPGKGTALRAQVPRQPLT